MFSALNNLIKYSLTYLASTKVLYSFKIKELLDLLNINNLNLSDLTKVTSQNAITPATSIY